MNLKTISVSACLAAMALTGCQGIVDPIVFEVWSASSPPRMCVGERMRVEYKIGEDCPASGCGSAQHPSIAIGTIPSMPVAGDRIAVAAGDPMMPFAMRFYPTSSYSGAIYSEPVFNAGQFEFAVRTASFSHLAWSLDRTRSGRPIAGTLRMGVWAAPTRNFTVRAYGQLEKVPENVVFAGQSQCPRRWTDVPLVVGSDRSAGVKVEMVCNQELARDVAFTFHTAAGLSEHVAVPAGECRPAPGESELPTLRFTSISAEAPALSTEFPVCAMGVETSPPEPILAGIHYGCD